MSEKTNEKQAVTVQEQGTAERDKSLNIFERMLKATSEIERVAKNLKVDISAKQSYKAVAEADVLYAVKPIEEKYGIYSYPISRKVIKDKTYTTTDSYNGNTKERNTFFFRLETVYRFVNVDKPDEFIDITTYGDGVDTQDKAPGKAMTYADKYALLKAYKIQTGEDSDADPSGNLNRPKENAVGSKQVNPPTEAQLTEAKALNIDLNRLAAYLKIKVSDISSENLAAAIEQKKKALEKKKEQRTSQTAEEPAVSETHEEEKK